MYYGYSKKLYKNQIVIGLIISAVSYVCFLFFDYHYPDKESKVNTIKSIFRFLLSYGIVLTNLVFIFKLHKFNKKFIFNVCLSFFLLASYFSMDLTSYLANNHFKAIVESNKTTDKALDNLITVDNEIINILGMLVQSSNKTIDSELKLVKSNEELNEIMKLLNSRIDSIQSVKK